MDFYDQLIHNIRKIIADKNLTQDAVAEYMGTSASQFSRILSGNVRLSIANLANLASNLAMREIDIITYPDVYICAKDRGTDPIEAVLQIRLTKEKKDQVLRLMFGEHNIEILNR